MPYYHKIYGVMSDRPWDSHSMEMVTIEKLADHRQATQGLLQCYDKCSRCSVIISLEEALTNYLKGKV